MSINQATTLGAGVIGASWTALFLAAGIPVNVYDPMKGSEKQVRDYIENAWPTLQALGMTDRGNPEAVKFFSDPVAAVSDSEFIQESIPERIDLKR